MAYSRTCSQSYFIVCIYGPPLRIYIGSLQATTIYLDKSNTAGNESVPDSALVNGAGRYVGGPDVPWSRINVEPGKRYRLRIVNTSALARYRFSIQGHPLTVCLTVSIVIDAVTDNVGPAY